MSYFEIKDLASIDDVAEQFMGKYCNERIFAFRGAMGIGKTTFIKSICKILGVKDSVNSPSFAIINEYSANDDTLIYHFDFYRLKTIEEAYDMGYEDYFYSGAYCFVEWPDKIEELMPQNRVDLFFDEFENHKRIIKVEVLK